jgi:hypothetical protein
MNGDWRVAVPTSLGWGLVVALASYAAMRASQVLLGSEPDPAEVVFSPHAGFFWRCLTTLYAGAMASFVAWAASRGHPRAAARGLAAAIPIAAGLLALQALFFP